MRSEGRALFVIGLVLVGLAVLLAVCGTWIAPLDPAEAGDAVATPPPPFTTWPELIRSGWSGARTLPIHWFGTDDSGMDILSRTLAAARTDVVIAVAANVVSFVVGCGLGLLTGYTRHWSSGLVMRISDVLQSFPVFITAMILVALAGRSATNIVIALSLVYTPIYIRLTRAEVLTQRQRGYVESARAIGCSEGRIALRYVLPSSLSAALTQSSVTIGFAILLTAGLSFIGAGVRPPTAEWGLMIANGASGIVLGEWWPAVFPGVAISLTVFGFAALGHGLQQRLAQ
jgi:peptide/nickel transport system permease protein